MFVNRQALHADRPTVGTVDRIPPLIGVVAVDSFDLQVPAGSIFGLMGPNGATTITRLVSLFPPATPLVMLARINVLRPPTWEIWLGIALLVAATVALVWVTAKRFRFTLLMSGKRPAFSAVVRLIRAA